jgi:hypothetical protein
LSLDLKNGPQTGLKHGTGIRRIGRRKGGRTLDTPQDDSRF